MTNVGLMTLLLARAPIYGTRDAGRGLWKELKEVVTKTGLRQSRLCAVLFTYSEAGNNKVTLGSHVDDLLFACKPGHEHFVTKIKKAFDVDDSKSLPTRIFVFVVVKFHKTKKEISK